MIHVFIGTKAQLIKMAPIMKELETRKIEYNFIVSGQHSETMEDLIKNFNIKKPDIVLYNGPDITKVSQMFFWGVKVISKALKQRKQVFRDDKNGVILNHGDTFSTLIGSVLAKLAGLKSAHVESGLRSNNFFHPFPEEIFRVLTFKLTDIYFCPNQWALDNLKKHKGIKINTQANTLLDSVNMAINNSANVQIEIPSEKYAIASLHRYENVFNKKSLIRVVEIIEEIARKIKVVFILHPPTKKNLHKFNLTGRLESNPNIELRPRYSYFDFMALLNKSEFLISDGGSNQEESSYLGKPCLLLRKATERPEGIGGNVVLSSYENKLIQKFVSNYRDFQKMQDTIQENPSKIIVESLIRIGFNQT